MRRERALPIFSIVFPLIYLPAMYYNWPVFTYVPRVREFHSLRYLPPQGDGPAIYYYGWLLTAGIGAAAIALALSALPEKTARRIPANLAWIVPLAVLAVLLDILSPWFTH
jgi:hypothetical protein